MARTPRKRYLTDEEFEILDRVLNPSGKATPADIAYVHSHGEQVPTSAEDWWPASRNSQRIAS
jgi:hypothetical protein